MAEDGPMLKKLLTTVVTLIAVVAGVTFAAKNPQAVSISYYFDLVWEGPLVIALITALLAGVVLGAVPLLVRVIQLKRRLKTTGSAAPGRTTLQNRSQEVNELRARQ